MLVVVGGFGFHVTGIEGLLEETGNPRQEKNNVKVCSPWPGAYPKIGVGSLKSLVETGTLITGNESNRYDDGDDDDIIDNNNNDNFYSI